MSTWDPTAFQAPGGGGGGQQPPQQQQPPQAGGIKLFDPTQFQGHAPQPHSAHHGDGVQQQQQQEQQHQQHFQQPHHPGAYFQQGQEGSSWDHWGNWNWNTEGQNAAGGGGGGQVGEGMPPHAGGGGGGGEANMPPTSQAPAQFPAPAVEKPGEQASPGQTPFYNPQQYYNGGGGAVPATTTTTAVTGNQAGGDVQPHSAWNWSGDQMRYGPVSEGDDPQQQQQMLAAQEAGGQGQYYYHHHQGYYDPSAWNNNTDPAALPPPQPHQPYPPQWGQQPSGGQDPAAHHNMSGQPGAQGVVAGNSVVDAGRGGVEGSGAGVPPPAVDVSSHPSDPTPPAVPSQGGHARQGSVDSNASGTVARFYGHEDDAQAPGAQGQAPADPVSMQHLQVKAFQRTDSGISNASLQTVNLSADEEGKDGGVEEMSAQMAALHMNPSGGHPAAGGGQPSQLYAHPGDFSGFGNYGQAPPQDLKVNREEAVSSGSGDSDLQSPMMNDWEIVPPQAHSSASHSRTNSLEDGGGGGGGNLASGPPPETASAPEEAKPPMSSSTSTTTTATTTTTTPEVNPVGTQSTSTQDSESFTAISSTSSGEVPSSVPFSQGSSYYPTASSTPLTSPGSQSVFSQPSSLPSWQSSPQQAAETSPAPATASSQPSPEKSSLQPESPARSLPSSPEKVVTANASPHSKDSEKSLYSSAVSHPPWMGEITLPRPAKIPGPRLDPRPPEEAPRVRSPVKKVGRRHRRRLTGTTRRSTLCTVGGPGTTCRLPPRCGTRRIRPPPRPTFSWPRPPPSSSPR